MSESSFVAGDVPERFVEVDAARLLLLLDVFAKDARSAPPEVLVKLAAPVTRYLTPEYLLQKLYFLLRNPRHLAYELCELYRMGVHLDKASTVADIQSIVTSDEPELRTDAYRKFWHGAYERLDAVESWWTARRLVFIRAPARGTSPGPKHYLLTAAAGETARRLRAEVAHAAWHGRRADLLFRYFGLLTAAEIKALQYELPGYREAQLGTVIPDVPWSALRERFRICFGEDLERTHD